LGSSQDRELDRAEVYQEQMVQALHAQFTMQQTEILSNAQGGAPRKSLVGATKAQTQKWKRDWLALLLSWAAYNDSMRKALAPIIYAIVVETGQ
jgi:hypothetical protein